MTSHSWLRRSARAGSAAIEFAAVAPAMLMFLFGVLELGRMAYELQALQVVGQQTARCVAIGSGACSTPDSYAVALASAFGVTIVSADVTVATVSASTIPAPVCVPPNTNTMVQVTISPAFTSPVSGLVPGLNQTLRTVACYPRTGT